MSGFVEGRGRRRGGEHLRRSAIEAESSPLLRIGSSSGENAAREAFKYGWDKGIVRLIKAEISW